MSDTTIRPALTPEEWEGEPATFVGTCPKVGIRAGVVGVFRERRGFDMGGRCFVVGAGNVGDAFF